MFLLLNSKICFVLVSGYDPGLDLSGGWTPPPPSSYLQTLIFEWKSAINFNPWAKFHTFRQLTPQFFFTATCARLSCILSFRVHVKLYRIVSYRNSDSLAKNRGYFLFNFSPEYAIFFNLTPRLWQDIAASSLSINNFVYDLWCPFAMWNGGNFLTEVVENLWKLGPFLPLIYFNDTRKTK